MKSYIFNKTVFKSQNHVFKLFKSYTTGKINSQNTSIENKVLTVLKHYTLSRLKVLLLKKKSLQSYKKPLMFTVDIF